MSHIADFKLTHLYVELNLNFINKEKPLDTIIEYKYTILDYDDPNYELI